MTYDYSTTIDRLASIGLPTPPEDLMPESDLGNHESFTLRKNTVQHPEFHRAIREIAHIHRRYQERQLAEGLMIYGQSGAGKTTLIEFYLQQFRPRRVLGMMVIPVLYVITPVAPTIKMLAEAFLIAMGCPASSKGTTAEKLERIISFLETCHVQLIVIDEFQHFFEGRRSANARQVSDWLKNLLSRSGRPVILVGLPKSISVLNENAQLRRRFAAPFYLQPFGYLTAAQQGLFRAVLRGLQRLLPFPCVDLSTGEMARCFYYASMGLIDYVIKILDHVGSRGGSGPGRLITQTDLALAFRRAIWDACPDELNPFVPGANLRRLTQKNEPFDGWEDPDQYTMSSRAKGLKKSVQQQQEPSHA